MKPTAIVTFAPRSRGRYAPTVRIGGTKKIYPPISGKQLESFRNRFLGRRIQKPTIHPAQRPMHGWIPVGDWGRYDYYVICKCGKRAAVPVDAMRITCEKCRAITPIKYTADH